MNRTKTVVAALAALVMAAFFTGCGDKNLVIEGTVLHGAKDRTKLPANLKIPNGIEEIGGRAFKECKAIRTVTFPKTLKKIGEEAFYNCNNLTVQFDGTKAQWQAIEKDDIGTFAVKCTDGELPSQRW